GRYILPGTNNFGITVAGVGDVNGDNFPDVAVGGNASPGIVRVFTGRSGTGSGTALTPAITLNGTTGGWGVSVIGPGDTNGDGFADVVIGSPNEAHVVLWRGAATPTTTIAWTDTAHTAYA